MTRANRGTESHLFEQCAFEIEVATRLRQAGPLERMKLYGEIYDEYARRYPEVLPKGDEQPKITASYEAAFARKFVTPSSVVVELGPGRCDLAFDLARTAAKIYGVDVSAVVTDNEVVPPNFQLLLTDGVHIPLPDCSADFVISKELMEHLHPDDAAEQLREVHRVLKPGGRYLCGTPNRMNGPHDCSNRFPELACPIESGMYVANGLHLKEYTNRELVELFRQTGLTQATTYVGARGHYLPVPVPMMAAVEIALRVIPARLRTRSALLRMLLGIRIVARKTA